MFYALYNKSNNTHLTHPSVGLWYTDNKREAEDMLEVCHHYLRASGLGFLAEQISLVTFETEEEMSK